MIPEDLMREYKYGYVHSCEMLNEPFVKDLIKENRELDKENNKLVAKLNKNKILQNEFRKWLENEIKECKDAEEKYADGDDNSYYNNNELRIEILSKYKEIIGGKE